MTAVSGGKREEIPAAASPGGRWRCPLAPMELVAFAAFVGGIVFLRLYGLRTDWNSISYTLWPFFRGIPRILVLGIGLQLIWHAGSGFLSRSFAPVREYCRSLGRPGWWLLWLRLYLVYGLTVYSYFWLKVSIPLVHYRLFDAELWRLDRWLHGGISPSVLAAELVAGTPLAPLLGTWYGWWIASVMAVIAFFAADSRPALRRGFMLSCALLWAGGVWIYLAFPSLGPCYTSPDVFERVLSGMPGVQHVQQLLWENYQLMLAGRSGVLTRFNPTRGIAALPSLHVGAHVLFLLWARHRLRPLRVVFLAGALLTFLGSLATGWHYAVDGYVGAVLAWGVYRLTRWLEPDAFPEAATTPAVSR